MSAGSSLATRWGRPSMTVTSTPKDFHMEANSQPITPPPRTMALLGTKSISSASVEVMIRPPISTPRVLEIEPEASTMCLPV